MRWVATLLQMHIAHGTLHTWSMHTWHMVIACTHGTCTHAITQRLKSPHRGAGGVLAGCWWVHPRHLGKPVNVTQAPRSVPSVHQMNGRLELSNPAHCVACRCVLHSYL